MNNMDFGLALETEIFLLSVLLGGGLGVVYDFLRVFRALLSHGKVLTFIEDFVYMLLAGFALFTFSTGLAGEIRYFTVAGMVMGWVLERYTVGNGVVFVIRSILNTLREKIFSPVFGFIAKTLKKLGGKFVGNKPKFPESKKNDEKLLKAE